MKNTFSRGVHPLSQKELSMDRPIENMPVKKVYIPLLQHIGKASTSIVEVGDEVLTGQLIGRANGAISANVYSSVTGKVVAIEKRKTALGKEFHIVIECAEEEKFFSYPRLENPTKEQILQRVQEFGIVGMGGAGFPTFVKLSPKDKVDTLIINGAECEPYITCDYRVMLEHTNEFLQGCLLIAKACDISNIIIGIEDNKPKAIEKLNESIGANHYNIKVVPLVAKYPQGAEKQMIYATTKRKVEVGKLPASVGVVVCNVYTAYSIYQAIEEGKPSYERVMTVTGEGIVNPSNLLVKNGTLFNEIIEHCGGLSSDRVVKLINGGPMMGIALSGGEIASTKTTSCILALTDDRANLSLPSACINCSSCAKVCPMHLMPMYIDKYSIAGDYEKAKKYGAMNCIECGSCAYVCPAKRTLVQSIRLAKKKIKENRL